MSDAGFPVRVANGVHTPEPFRVEEARPAGTDAVLIVLHGDVDLHVAPELRGHVDGAIEGGATNLVIDLSHVSFLDSMALGLLLGTLRRLHEQGGDLRLVVPTAQLRRIFEITLLDEVFVLARTRQEALAAFSGSWGV